MNTLKAILVLTLMVLSVPALADVSADANSGSSSDSTASAGAVNGGINFNPIYDSTGTIRYKYGDQVIKNTPSMGMGSFSNSFSSDYCGGTMQGTVALAGLGLGAGKPIFDKTCQILRVVEKTANLAQQRLQVDQDQAKVLLRATDLLMCKALPGVTEEAFSEAGLNCGSAAPKVAKAEEEQVLAGSTFGKAFGQP